MEQYSKSINLTNQQIFEIFKGDFGMLTNTAKDMACYLIKSLIDFFGDKMSGYSIFDVNEDVNNKSFRVKFLAYNYFPVSFVYDKGGIGFSICYGTYFIPLKNSQQWWDQADINILLTELEKDLILRIPDKFLKAHGWL